MTILNTATRAAAVAALLGAAVGTAQATDWDKLQSQGQGWSGGESAAASDGMSDMTAGAGGGNWGAEIASAFQNLGMDPARAECYGSVLTQQLPPDDQQQAAELVRTASSAEDVRSDVLGAGETLVGGFSAANTRCPEGMGG